jgi:osmotically-inducible protein OsmY
VAIGTGTARSDGDIALAATRVLARDETFATDTVLATVSKGRVTLWGAVHADRRRRDSERAVRVLPGVRGVTNLIAVRQPCHE